MGEPYVIRLSTRSDGMDVGEAEWNGQVFRATSRNGVTMAVARLLTSAGCPEGRWEGWGSGGGKRRLYGPSLHRLAGLTIGEADRAGLRLGQWEPNPMKFREAAE